MMAGSLLSAILTLSHIAISHSLPADHRQQQGWKRYNAAYSVAPIVEDVFEPMSFDQPPASIPIRDDHPQPPVGVNQNSPLQTNKFYASFFAAEQDNRTWVYPYSVWWPKHNPSQGRGLSSEFECFPWVAFWVRKVALSWSIPP